MPVSKPRLPTYRSGAVDVVVIDSVAALTPRAEIEGDGRHSCVIPPHVASVTQTDRESK